MTRISKRFAGVAVLALLTGLTGCGVRGTGTLKGKVTFANKPVICGHVMVIASDNRPYHGELGPDGSFTITEVPTGPGKVAVISPDPNPKVPTVGMPAEGAGGKRARMPERTPQQLEAAKGWFPIPEKYAGVGTSGLTVEVVSGDNPPLDLVLTK